MRPRSLPPARVPNEIIQLPSTTGAIITRAITDGTTGITRVTSLSLRQQLSKILFASPQNAKWRAW
jgi:hypothetical protein